MNIPSPKRETGFTLIELSIVLVIISLIVGGVIGGKSLINSARIQETITDFKKFETAINNFYLSYDALPGDFNEATSYWTGTANGNNNKRISNMAESLRAWQHLSLAEMINGNYTGTGTFSAGISVPAGSFNGSGYQLIHHDGATLYGIHGNNIQLEGDTNVTTGLDGAILSPQQALPIDKKLDDGIATRGRMVAFNGLGRDGNCTSGSDYDKANTGRACRLFLFIDNR